MGEIRLDDCCRLCLKEGFSLINIFSYRSAAGDPLHRILHFIYDIEVFEDDGFPSQICSPCMWRMIEFDACKRNVRSAEAEIMKLKSAARPRSNKVSDDGAVTTGTQMDGASKLTEFGMECNILHSEVPIKEETNILDGEIPLETAFKTQVTVEHFKDDDGEEDYFERQVEPVEIPAEEFDDRGNERVFCQPLRECSSEFNSHLEDNHSTVNDSPVEDGINPGRMFAAEKICGRMAENYARDYKLVSAEAVSAILSSRNVAESEFNDSNFPLNSGKYEFNCDICEKSFPTKVGVGRHVRIHYDVRPFICSVCGQAFKQDQVRNEHQLRHLRDAEEGIIKKPYTCGICGKNFSLEKSLVCHQHRHNKTYSCTVCGKGFGCKYHLKEHSVMHTSQTPFQCEVCLKNFCRKSNLKQHMVIHSQERPFSCSFCDKKFKFKHIKERHQLLHLRKN